MSTTLLKPRWIKVLSDLWDNKRRTILVIASIAVGVFAIGMIMSAYVIMADDIDISYAAANPVNIEIWTDPFYEDLPRILERSPGVDDVEGQQVLNIRGRKSGETWEAMTLIAKVIQSSCLHLRKRRIPEEAETDHHCCDPPIRGHKKHPRETGQ